MLLECARSILAVVDIQTKLHAVMHEGERVVTNAAVLLQAADTMSVPTLVTEQYPKGIGPTVDALTPYLPADGIIEKTVFSCQAAPQFAARLADSGRDQVVLAGIEAHVCMLQSAFDLMADGLSVYVVSDATTSRSAQNYQRALERMAHAGVHIVTTEMVLFEWLRRSDVPQFKSLSQLIK